MLLSGQRKKDDELGETGELSNDGSLHLHAAEDKHQDHRAPLPTRTAEALQSIGEKEQIFQVQLVCIAWPRLEACDCEKA